MKGRLLGQSGPSTPHPTPRGRPRPAPEGRRGAPIRTRDSAAQTCPSASASSLPLRVLPFRLWWEAQKPLQLRLKYIYTRGSERRNADSTFLFRGLQGNAQLALLASGRPFCTATNLQKLGGPACKSLLTSLGTF